MKINFYIITFLLLLLALDVKSEADVNSNYELDSLSSLLKKSNNCENRLDVLHHACKLLYKMDNNHELLIKYAEEGFEIAETYQNIEKGADLAVWILRANIYLRNYSKNPVYYEYLKKLYLSNQIEQSKYIQPLYSEIYSYIDYGKMKEAEVRMKELEPLIDKSNYKQHTYYLDLFISFKRKLKESKDASAALAEFVQVAKKIDDPRFEVIAFSRNSGFYLDDSLNYNLAKYYALEALNVVNSHKLDQYRDPILLQLTKAYYKLEDFDSFVKTFDKISENGLDNNDKILNKDYHTFSGDINFNNKEYKVALTNYRTAMQYLEDSDFSAMELLTKKIEKVHVKLGDYQAAYTYANRLNVLQDSLYNEENLKAIKVFESRLKYKDIETERIKLENKIQAQKRSTLYIGFFSSLILLSLLFYNRILDEKVRIRTSALDDKNTELKRSLEELEQFNYIASHDIKEPMRVVSSVTGLIQKKLELRGNVEYKPEFTMVKDSITQLYTLIEDLSQFLDFKAKSITHQIVDTNTLVNQVTHMLGKVISEKNAKVEFNDLPKIYSSSSLLTVIFKNLIENGIKYNDSETPTIRVNYKKQNGRHEFTVSDNGIGIPEKYHDYVFQMFKRLKNTGKNGSGLGLGLVAKSIEKLDGVVRLESQPDKGSHFTISLPESYIIAA